MIKKSIINCTTVIAASACIHFIPVYKWETMNIIYNNSKWDKCDSTNSLYEYAGNNKYIDLETLEWIDIDVDPSNTFKSCSKYKYQFVDYRKITKVYCNGTTFEITEKNDLKITTLKNSYIINPECNEKSSYYYNSFLLAEENNINHVNHCNETGFTITKYNYKGEQIKKTVIKNDWITKKGNDNHHETYRVLTDYVGKELIFYTNPKLDANQNGTLVLNLQDFSITEYSFINCGYLIDQSENDKGAGLFIIDGKDIILYMVDSKIKYKIPADNAIAECKGILIGNLIVITSYHSNATGSALFCYNIDTGIMEWIADVEQLQIDHSKYFNAVYLSLYKNKVILEGHESGGYYLQIFDLNSGKKLFNDIKKSW